jgi:hypothetical protein
MRLPYLLSVILGVAISLQQTCVQATTYYLSSQRGDDSASGRAAEGTGPDRPWKSLERASFQEFRNGDALLLRCGERFEGRLDIRVSEGEGLLRIAPYGDCAEGQAPVLDGTVSVQGIERNGRFRAKLPHEPGRVVVAGKTLARAFARFQVVNEPGSAGSPRLQPALPPVGSLVQALAMVRSRDWLVEPVRIAGRGGPLGLGNLVTQYPLQVGVGLAITGKEWVLSREGWIYDKETGELLVASAGAPVRVAEPRPLVRIRGAGSVLIDGLRLENAGENGLEFEIKGVATLRGSAIIAAARHGIEIRSAENFSSIDNRIIGAGEHAINVTAANRVTVLRNVVEDTATLEPLMASVAALHVERARNATVAQSRIERSGYVAIRFGEGAEIRSNLVVDSCLRLSDCAAIYTWVNAPLATRRPSRVSGNLIVNVIGNDEVKLGAKVHAAGLYLDDFTTLVNVEDNVVFGARQGIYLHNSFMHRLVRNVTIGDREESFAVHIDSSNAAITSMRSLGNQVVDSLMLPAEKASGLSVIRRVRVDPFSEFKGSHQDEKTSPEIVWIENAASFEQPNYRKEVVPPGESKSILQGLRHQQRASVPATGNWSFAVIDKTIRVFSQGRRFQIGAGGGNCSVIVNLQNGALDMSGDPVALSDCGR